MIRGLCGQLVLCLCRFMVRSCRRTVRSLYGEQIIGLCRGLENTVRDFYWWRLSSFYMFSYAAYEPLICLFRFQAITLKLIFSVFTIFLSNTFIFFSSSKWNQIRCVCVCSSRRLRQSSYRLIVSLSVCLYGNDMIFTHHFFFSHSISFIINLISPDSYLEFVEKKMKERKKLQRHNNSRQFFFWSGAADADFRWIVQDTGGQTDNGI